MKPTLKPRLRSWVESFFGEGEGVVFFFAVAVGADGAGVVAAVAGVDDNGVDAVTR